MSHLATALLLFAQRDPRLSGIASTMRAHQAPPDPQTVWGLLLALGGLILIFWLIAQALERWEQRGPRNSPWGLFYALGKSHQLRWPELWLLWRLARRQHLADPARLFLEPERLDPAQLTAWPAAEREQFQRLRQRLFVGLERSSPSLAEVPAGEAAIPLFPPLESPGLDLPPWNLAAGDSPAAAP